MACIRPSSTTVFWDVVTNCRSRSASWWRVLSCHADQLRRLELCPDKRRRAATGILLVVLAGLLGLVRARQRDGATTTTCSFVAVANAGIVDVDVSLVDGDARIYEGKNGTKRECQFSVAKTNTNSMQEEWGIQAQVRFFAFVGAIFTLLFAFVPPVYFRMLSSVLRRKKLKT